MNILILSTHLNTGGITSYIITLAKSLKKKNHNIYVVTSGGDRIEALTLSGIEHTVLDIRTKSELSFKIYLSLNKLCRLVKEKNIDIIHTQTRVTQVMGTILGRLTGKPHLSTCHGFFKARLSRKIFPCWGDSVIAISEAVRHHLIGDFGVDENKVVLIHHGIDVSAFPAISGQLKHQRRLEFGLDDGPLVGIIARLSDVKGHRILISAMKQVVTRVTDAHLIIVGEGRLENELKILAKDLLLEDRIHFYPVVNRTAEILSVLDVFVMPSLQEGLGLSVMEAQASGLAVVASRVGGIPSLIQDQETGILVPPGDGEALASAIVQCLTDKAKAEKLGANARRFIEERCSADRMVDETEKLYESILKK